MINPQNVLEHLEQLFHKILSKNELTSNHQIAFGSEIRAYSNITHKVNLTYDGKDMIFIVTINLRLLSMLGRKEIKTFKVDAYSDNSEMASEIYAFILNTLKSSRLFCLFYSATLK